MILIHRKTIAVRYRSRCGFGLNFATNQKERVLISQICNNIRELSSNWTLEISMVAVRFNFFGPCREHPLNPFMTCSKPIHRWATQLLTYYINGQIGRVISARTVAGNWVWVETATSSDEYWGLCGGLNHNQGLVHVGENIGAPKYRRDIIDNYQFFGYYTGYHFLLQLLSCYFC